MIMDKRAVPGSGAALLRNRPISVIDKVTKDKVYGIKTIPLCSWRTFPLSEGNALRRKDTPEDASFFGIRMEEKRNVQMRRNGSVVVLAHCLLNADAKVKGLAEYPGALLSFVLPLFEEGVGVIQLPCPEATFLGGARWGMTREQYDTTAFRRHCRCLLTGTMDQLESHLRSGHSVEGVVGVDGSPSCGVFFSCSGYEGGEISIGGFVERSRNALRRCRGEGIFMAELRVLLSERGIFLPFSAVDEESSEGTTWREVRRKFRHDADGMSSEA